MSHKTSKSFEILAIALEKSQNPYVLSSFGKDSLAVLDMAATFGVRRVLYLEDRDEIVDNFHIAKTVERYKLEVTRLNSGRGLLYFINKEPMLLGFPFVNQRVMLPIPTNIDPYEPGKPFTCVDERLSAHHGVPVNTDADLIIMGFKLADWETNTCRVVVDKLSPGEKDAYLARYKHIMDAGMGLKVVYPLLDWSHGNVWDYLERRQIEASPLMYDGREKRPHTNPVCYRCHDPYGPPIVECPKLGKPLANMPFFAPDADLRLAQLERIGILSKAESEALNG